MRDICVAGGGLTGLMMATALSYTPYNITLLDRSDGKSAPHDERTTTIHAAGRRMLDAMGLWDQLDPQPAPIDAIHVATGPASSGLAARQRKPFDLSWESASGAMGYVVHNHSLFDALVTGLAARKITHLAQTAVRDMTVAAGQAHLTIDDGDAEDGAETSNRREVTCQLVVACDGARSPLREAAGLRQFKTRDNQSAVVATMRLDRDHQNAAYQRFLRSGPIALMPLAGRTASLVWTVRNTEAKRLLSVDADQFSAECSAAFGPYLGYLELVGERFEWPLQPAIASGMTAPHMALAGDAAHALHPLAGQGYNLALGDAAVLADALCHAHRRGLPAGHRSVLDDYAAGRRVEVSAMSAMTTSLNALFSTAPHGLARVAGIGMGLVNASPAKSVFSTIASGGSLARASLLAGRLPDQIDSTDSG